MDGDKKTHTINWYMNLPLAQFLHGKQVWSPLGLFMNVPEGQGLHVVLESPLQSLRIIDP